MHFWCISCTFLPKLSRATLQCVRVQDMPSPQPDNSCGTTFSNIGNLHVMPEDTLGALP